MAKGRTGVNPWALGCAALLALAAASAAEEPARPPVVARARAILFLFDTSGSLRPADLENGRRVARDLAARLAAGDAVGVLSFDDRPELRAALGSDGQAFEAGLSALAIRGRETHLHDALFDASRMLGESGAERRAIVLLSDGRDEGSALLFEDAERQLTRDEVAVFAVGVGSRIEERFLRRLAKLRGGEYFDAASLGAPEALGLRVDALLALVPPSATPQPPPPPAPEPTPLATPIPPRASPPAAAVTPAPAGQAQARRYFLVGAVFVLLALAILVAHRLVAGRRPAAAAAPRPFGASGAVAAGRLEPPVPELPDAASGPAGAEASAPDAVLETIPIGSAPPAPLAPRLAEAGAQDDEPLDPLSRTVVTGLPPGLGDSNGIHGEQLDRTFLLELKAVLVVRKGRNSGEKFLLREDGDTHLGRGQVNDVVLADKAVSTRHARIRAEGKVFTLSDLQSTNGTFLNDIRIERGRDAFLKEGDVIRVGETELEFKIEQHRR